MTKESERIVVLETNQNNMTEKLNKMDSKIDMILDKFEQLEGKFVLRSEFKIAISVISALAVIIWVISYFIDK